jgi:hypothetical protein
LAEDQPLILIVRSKIALVVFLLLTMLFQHFEYEGVDLPGGIPA